jgi:hypothetical protein
VELHRHGFESRTGAALVSGEVEVDETFIGGKARNMHVAQRKRRINIEYMESPRTKPCRSRVATNREAMVQI